MKTKKSLFLMISDGHQRVSHGVKNQFVSDLLIDRSNNLAIFGTSKGPIKYVGKFNIQDDRETDMMASRWQIFSFFHDIERPRVIKPCPRCFAELVLLGADLEELES